MQIYIGVKKFGKIESAEINISNYTIFVGQNNSGKTYMMQLIYGVLREIENFTWDIEEDRWKQLQEGEMLQSDQFFWQILNEQLGQWLTSQKEKIVKKTFGVDIEIEELTMRIEPENCEVSAVLYTEENMGRQGKEKEEEEKQLGSLFNKYGGRFSIFSVLVKDSARNSRKSFAVSHNFEMNFRSTFSSSLIMQILNIFNGDEHQMLFLPASRTGLMLLYRHYFSGKKTQMIEIDETKQEKNENSLGVALPVYEFLQFLQTYKARTDVVEQHQELLSFIEQHLIDGKVEDVGEESVYVPEGRRQNIPLYLASSMINELTPLIKALTSIPDIRYLMYDEIETCLHPSKQGEMARLFNRMSNQGIRLIVSTHSDTMASKINNLLLLSFWEGTEEEKAKKCAALGLEKADLLQSKNVHVYEFVNTENGTSQVRELIFHEMPYIGYDFTLFTENTTALYEESKEILGLKE